MPTTNLKHGYSGGHRRNGKPIPPEYQAWTNAKGRCYNKNDPRFADYGGRGIGMCEEWRKDFSAFLAYIGPRPSPKHSLDRYPNNDGNYEPGNVRWAIPEQQVRNRRPVNFSRYIVVLGVRITLTEAAQKYRKSCQVIRQRLDRGWSPERAVGLFDGPLFHY